MTKYDFSGCIEIPEPFSLGLTLLSGQCFRWDGPDHTGYFNGVVDQKVIRLKQVGNRLFYDVIGNKMNSTKVVEAWLMSYFRFNDPLEKWYRDFQVIPIMRQAALALHGMRVLRQDPWECAISFMCAQGLSVEIIRIVIQNLCEKHGELIADTNSQTFPSIQKISEQNAVFFRRCTNNYLNRADRMIRFARCLLNDVFQLDHLRNISNEQARFFLTLFDGIGPKIADCILLFSLDHLAAFPIDRWVLRALIQMKLIKKSLVSTEAISTDRYWKLAQLAQNILGPQCGVANLYLFFYLRILENSSLRKKLDPFINK